MQAKTSVSDYRESSEVPWAARQRAALVGHKKPQLVVVSSKADQTKLKPGLY